MPITSNSSAWRLRSAVRGRGDTGTIPAGLPSQFIPTGADVSDEAILELAPATRGAGAPGPLDLSTDLRPDQAAVLAVRHPSGALTFHLPVESKTRGGRGAGEVRFQVSVRATPTGPATRGVFTTVAKAIVVKVGKFVGENVAAFVVPKLVSAFEKALWKRKKLQEGWLQVTPETLKSGALKLGKPVKMERSLLFVHGTFSNAASAFGDLGDSTFFTRVKDLYDDRIFAFNHYSLSRTPEENARMLVDELPAKITFDVVTHSRGGLVLRNLVERASKLGPNAGRFQLGHAILVASPNDGTPLATPDRWEEVLGWLSNIIELFPDNPFTTGADFVANGLEWIANHVVGNVPGLQAMDQHGDQIADIQAPPGPGEDAYSALVANYNPDDGMLAKLLDAGMDQFFSTANDLVVPSAGGWQVDRGRKPFIPGRRIGCFGPGGNLPGNGVNHVSFFKRRETADFLVNALEGRPQPLSDVDPRKPLPDRRVIRGRSAPLAPDGAPTVADVPPSMVPRRKPQPPGEPLHVEVHNGDLQFEAKPLMLGHYPAAQLLSTEKLMDGLIGGAMSRSLRAGLYPVDVGSHQIFVNTHRDARGVEVPRPEAVVVVGLGPEGNLKSADLVKSIRLAVVGWAREQMRPEARRSQKPFELAATLIGSGGTGVSPALSARAIVQGVWEANETLRNPEDGQPAWPFCRRIRLIELYLDRATEAWQALGQLKYVFEDKFVLDGPVFQDRGALVRPSDHGWRGATYDFITVTTGQEEKRPVLAFTLDSRRARSEVRAVHPQSRLVKELVASASNDRMSDERIRQTLFNLLIPVELEADLASTDALQLQLDDSVADIPWEILDVGRDRDRNNNDTPWAIQTKLIRKFRTMSFRERVVDAKAEDHILVIGEPACPPEKFGRLDAAREEAGEVARELRTAFGLPDDLDGRVRLLAPKNGAELGPDAQTVLNTLYERPWRIVHICGHGDLPDEEAKTLGGVVLSSKDTFLSSAEIDAMRVVPELVFVNCCHLASQTGGTVLGKPYNRTEFASGVARKLIDIGVKCVVAAGWAVEDVPARVFATTFYRTLLQGQNFINAVHAARKSAYDENPRGNTWAAYQCYGDPDWRFYRPATDWGTGPSPHYAIASMRGLKLELDRIAVQAGFDGADTAGKLREVRAFEASLDPNWRHHGDLAYAFGAAYMETGALEDAVRWLQVAVDATDAQSPIRAEERLANAESRLAWETVDKAAWYRDTVTDAGAKRAGGPRQRGPAGVPRATHTEARERVRKAVQQSKRLLASSNRRLQAFHATRPTMERESLLGSMHKRRALIAWSMGRKNIRSDLRAMGEAYRRAVRLGEREGNTELFYPAINCLVAELALATLSGRTIQLDKKMLTVLNRNLETHEDENATFWSVVTKTERDQYEGMSGHQLASRATKLEKAYRDLGRRVTSVRMWTSVYDNASLVLGLYERSVKKAGEKKAARAILDLIRGFAHPETKSAP